MSQLETLWYTRCPVPTGLGIAVQKGWLEQTLAGQGTRIQSLRESSEQAVRESHFDHSLQNSVRHGGNIPPSGPAPRAATPASSACPGRTRCS